MTNSHSFACIFKRLKLASIKLATIFVWKQSRSVTVSFNRLHSLRTTDYLTLFWLESAKMSENSQLLSFDTGMVHKDVRNKLFEKKGLTIVTPTFPHRCCHSFSPINRIFHEKIILSEEFKHFLIKC